MGKTEIGETSKTIIVNSVELVLEEGVNLAYRNICQVRAEGMFNVGDQELVRRLARLIAISRIYPIKPDCIY